MIIGKQPQLSICSRQTYTCLPVVRRSRPFLKPISRYGGPSSFNKPIIFLCCVILAILACGKTVYALDNPVIDTFSVDTEPNPLGDGEGGIAADRDILGGFRDVLVDGDVFGEGNENFFMFDGSGDINGTATLMWDGEDDEEDPTIFTPYGGLGG